MRTALTGRTHGCIDQPLRREDSPCQLGAVHTWHFRDMRWSRIQVSLRGKSGRSADAAEGPSLTQLGHAANRSFDHLVGTDEQFRWNLDTESVRCLFVYHQIECRGLLDRKIAGLCPLHNPVYVRCSPPVEYR